MAKNTFTKSSKTKNLAKKKADKYFSEYIRIRDKEKHCCTCGNFTTEKDCGHFISRAYEATRYDEQNSHGQCISCNRFKHGKQYEHSLHIAKLYGQEVPDKLLKKSKMLCKRNKHDYEYLAEYFKKKCEELKD